MSKREDLEGVIKQINVFATSRHHNLESQARLMEVLESVHNLVT